MLDRLRIFIGAGFVALGLSIGIVACASAQRAVLWKLATWFVLGGLFIITVPVARVFDGLFHPDTGDVKPELSRPRALIAEHRYTEAETELRACLAAQPSLIPAVRLLANLLHENLGRSDEALALAQQTLTANAWRPEHEQLATLAVDILLNRRDTAAAAELLRVCVAKAEGTAAAGHLQKRLQHLG